MPSLLINNEKVKDPVTAANAFNTFSNNYRGLKLQQVRNDDISFSKDVFPVKFPDMEIISTTESEIKSIIDSLK
jgi:hypothetical protein